MSSRLSKLKSAACLSDLANLLGFKPSALSFILYHIPNASKYSEFEIPKRSGGLRKIKSPEPRLKTLQTRLARLLYDCIEEIEGSQAKRKPLSHAFAKRRSILTNAARHKRRRFVFNLDLHEFFPSINFGRVRGFFIKDKSFQLDPAVATAIAQIACHDNELPQGSPCSPVISNLIGNVLDNRLVGIAKKAKCTYSRYADDITFSTSQATFPANIATKSAAIGGWEVSANLNAAISKAGFTVNPKKTRMQVRGSRQVATGLLVNEKPNILPEYYRTVRAMCASVFASGSYYRAMPATDFGGSKADPCVNVPASTLAELEGMLAHVYHVRNTVDQRDPLEKKKKPTSTRLLYQRFLHYKNFVSLDKPLIVTEGRTDQIYLRAAIEKRTGFHPRLGSIVSGQLKLAVRFLKYTSTLHDVLQLGGGTGDLKHLMLNHRDLLKRFTHLPLAHPVILLVDNDDGAISGGLFSVAKEMGVPAIDHASADPFYRVHKNLYLVKTPSLTGKVKTCVEDLFDPILLAEKLDGKSFDANKKHGDTTKYGKSRFAEKIVRPKKDSIDFTGFDSLLERIVKVLDDYKP